MTGRREKQLAAELELIAAELRDGRAQLCGYRVRRRGRTQATPDRTEETGAIDYSDGWLAFQRRE